MYVYIYMPYIYIYRYILPSRPASESSSLSKGASGSRDSERTKEPGFIRSHGLI